MTRAMLLLNVVEAAERNSLRRPTGKPSFVEAPVK